MCCDVTLFPYVFYLVYVLILKGLFVTSYTYKSHGSVSHARSHMHARMWLRCSDKTPTQTTWKHQNLLVVSSEARLLNSVGHGRRTRGRPQLWSPGPESLLYSAPLLLCLPACLHSARSTLTCMRAHYTLQKTS